MTHETMKEKVFAFHDDALSPGERTAVESHLAGCHECRADLESWRRTAGLFLRPPRTDASEYFVQKVMGRVRDIPASSGDFWGRLKSFFSPPRLVFAGGAALVLAVVLFPFRPTIPADPDAGVRYAVELVEESVMARAEEADFLGTAVEEYFL